MFYKCKFIDIMEENQKNWGGSRKGAGIKTISSSTLVTAGLTVETETKAKPQALAKKEGISMSEFKNSSKIN